MENTFKSILCFLIAVVIVNSGYCQENESGLSKAIKKVENSVFIIYTFDKNEKPISQGSGFFLTSNGVGVTNFHVLSGCYKALIKTKNGDKYSIIKILDFDSRTDLVKFKIDNPVDKIMPALTISPWLPIIGESIFNIGSPMGLEQTVSNGIVSSIRELAPFGNLIQITAPISEGSSGSPLLNMKGEVIGIATLGYTNGQNLNFAVSALKLRDLNKSRNCILSELNRNTKETDSYKRALEEYLLGNDLNAKNILNRIIESDSSNHMAYALKGQISIDNGDYGKAIEYFYYALSLDTSNIEYLNSFGVANANYGYQSGGDSLSFSIAYDAYSQAIKIDNSYSTAYLNMAWLLFNYLFSAEISQRVIGEQHVYTALELTNKAIKLNENFANAYSLRGQIKFKLNDNWAALEDINKAIELNSTNYDFYFFRGELKCFGLKDSKNSIIDLNIALNLAKTNAQKADIVGMRSIANKLSGDDYNACIDAQKANKLSGKNQYIELINKFCK